MPPTGPTSARPAAASSGPGRAPRNLRTPQHPTLVIRPTPLFVAAAILIALVVTPYLRPWISQRAEISQTKSQIAALEKEVADLEAQKARWDDDAYVRAQARARLFMVKPGEYSYTLLDDKTAAAGADPRAASVAVPDADAARPWYGTLWGSVSSAGDPSTRQLPTQPIG